MSILTGFKKVKNYILTSSGYQLLSRWTSSQTVEFDDGKTAQTKLGEINGIAKTYVDMKKATDNSMAVSAKAVMEGLENSSALISMTQEEYDALSDEEKTDNNMRAILDANPDVVDAKNVNFDNTNTNLTATNTQSAITELNGKLNYKHMNIKDGTAGITIPGDWIEAYVDITFSLNPQYYFTFHLIRDNLLSTNKKYLQDYYLSENDRHNICLVASATGVKLESYTYSGQDIGQNCEMNLFYR